MTPRPGDPHEAGMSYQLAGAGPPILMLHGLGGDRNRALELLPSGAPFTCLAPDLPGHGDSDLGPHDVVAFAAFADRAAALVDGLISSGSLEAAPVAVVGVSMGAGVALALAQRRRDLVARLVLIRPAWLDVAPPPNLAPFLVIAKLLTKLGAARGKKAFAESVTHHAIEREAPATAQSLIRQFDRPHARERAGVLTELPNSRPLPDRGAYARLDVQSLVLVAPHDPVHPLALGVQLAALLPRANLCAVPRKLPDPTEHQQGVQQAVSAYLAEAGHDC